MPRRLLLLGLACQLTVASGCHTTLSRAARRVQVITAPGSLACARVADESVVADSAEEADILLRNRAAESGASHVLITRRNTRQKPASRGLLVTSTGGVEPAPAESETEQVEVAADLLVCR
jgi:hypothetical protein